MKGLRDKIKSFLQDHPKIKYTLWFFGLWLGGLLAFLVVTFPLHLLITLAENHHIT